MVKDFLNEVRMTLRERDVSKITIQGENTQVTSAFKDGR